MIEWRDAASRDEPPLSPGGSMIQRVEARHEPSGCGNGSASFHEARSAVFDRLFGVPIDVDGGGAGDGLDVRIHSPGFADRSFYTLVTSGMSDHPMHTPPELGPEVRRAEMVLYVDQPGPSTVRLLRTLALMPRRSGMWLGHGHTLPNGAPPAPLFPGSTLDTLLILDTIVMPEREIWRHVTLDDEPLRLLNPVPITSRECAVKLTMGLPALLERFNHRGLSFVLDTGRDDLAV